MMMESLILVILIFGLLIILFSPLLWAWLRPSDQVNLPPPQWIEIAPDQKMAYYQLGPNTLPNLVLVHGFGASSYCWRYLLPLLSKHFRVTAIDLMGFGKSSCPNFNKYSLKQHSKWLEQALQALQMKSIVLVGSSMGGLICIHLTQLDKVAAKLNVQKVISISPALLGPKSRISKVRFKSSPILSWFIQTPLVTAWTVLMVTRRWSILNRESLKNYSLPHHISSGFRSLITLFDPSIPNEISQLPVPHILIWGQFDRVIPKKFITAYLQKSPQTQYVEIQTGHHPQEERPDLLAQLIISHSQIN